MTGSIRTLATLGAALTLVSATTVAAQGADDTEIRSVVTQQGDAWSRHDAKAYAALFTEDCDVVNVLGWWWHGRLELETKLTAAFSYVFSESQLTITDVQVRFVKPDVAVAHARWTMTGARTPPGGRAPSSGIQTLLLTRQEGHWLIAEFQNTNGVPERPFPMGPVSPANSRQPAPTLMFTHSFTHSDADSLAESVPAS